MRALSDYHKQIGARIRRIRTGMKISQEELAARSKVSLNQLGRIERGERSPTLATLLKICNGLGITTGELFADAPPAGHAANGRRQSEKDILEKKITETLKKLRTRELQLIHRLATEFTSYKD